MDIIDTIAKQGVRVWPGWVVVKDGNEIYVELIPVGVFPGVLPKEERRRTRRPRH